jgi:biopolymer transport protein ExbD
LHADPKLFNPRLVLLLTFLVLAPALRLWSGHHLLPDRSPQPDPNQFLTVWVQPDAIYIEDTLVAEADLSRVLGEVRDAYPQAAVIVRGDTADRRLSYGRVRHVLHLVNQAGFLRASLSPGTPPPTAG